MDEMAVSVYEDVSIVSVFDLEKVGDDGVAFGVWCVIV